MFVSDNGNLVAWALDTEIQVWDATTGRQLAKFDMDWDWPSEALTHWSSDSLTPFSSQGHTLVASSSSPSSPSPSSLLYVWDLTSKEPRHNIKVAGSIEQLVVSPEAFNRGGWVAAVTRDTIGVWDAMTMALQWSLKRSDSGHYPTPKLQLLNSELAVIWPPSINCYDVTSGAPLSYRELPGFINDSGVEGFSVSPGGQRMAWVLSGGLIGIISISQKRGGFEGRL